ISVSSSCVTVVKHVCPHYTSTTLRATPLYLLHALLPPPASDLTPQDSINSPTLSSGSTDTLLNSSTTFLNGTITNTGTILLNAGGDLTDLRISDGRTLTGGARGI